MKNLFFLALTVLFVACQSPKTNVTVLMETSKGDMKIKLYDDTPIHRDNFIKLAKQGYYDSLLFHRVMSEFMIQGGDPESKNAASGKRLGNGGPGYQIDSEFKYPKYFHKKGALAAARQPDKVNPEMRSSGSQFYIVQGTTYNDEQFSEVEQRLKSMKRQSIFYSMLEEYKDTLNQCRKAGNQMAMMDLKIEIEETVEKQVSELPPITIPDSIKQIYRTIGGVPHLDDNYTVFGEVFEGLEVIDEIAGVPTDKYNRPNEDVYILKVKVLK